jgi:hypothetical protein
MNHDGATHNLTAISTNSENAINEYKSVDLTLLSDIGDIVNLSPRREDNSDEANGKEEPDQIYDNGDTAETTRNHNRAQPQHFAYLFAYGLGVCNSVPAGSGYLHTITPIPRGVDLARDLPSMTLLTQVGETVLKRLFASMFVDSVTATFAKDAWVKINGSLKGTGKHQDSVEKEVVSAAADAVSLALAIKGVAGSTDDERLDSIHRIQAELTPGVWTDVVFTAVSSATPAVITITAPSVDAGAVDYKILFAPIEGAELAFPARVVESNLRVAEMSFNLGGSWNGSAFVGGRPYGAELSQIVCNLSNSSSVSFVPGGGGAYASMHERSQRKQTLKVDRKFRDFIFQQHIKDNDQMGAYIKCVGAEYEPGHNYQVEIIYPRLGLLSAPLSVNNRKMQEAGDFVVMEDDTYGSVIVRVKNKWPGYVG